MTVVHKKFSIMCPQLLSPPYTAKINNSIRKHGTNFKTFYPFPCECHKFMVPYFWLALVEKQETAWWGQNILLGSVIMGLSKSNHGKIACRADFRNPFLSDIKLDLDWNRSSFWRKWLIFQKQDTNPEFTVA